MKNTTQDKALLQDIFEASAVGIIAVAKDGYILLVNPFCEQLFGYGSSELAHSNIEILLPEKLNPQYNVYIQKQATLPLKKTEAWGIKKNGGKISLSIGLSPTVINGQKATIMFFWDATQHNDDLKIIKQTNAKLIESNRKFDALINNIKGIVFRCKNNRNFDMDFISEGCLEITGYSFDAFKTQSLTFGELILKEDRDHVWESIQNSLENKKQYDFEYRILHKDGSIKYVWEKGKAIYNKQNEVEMLEGFITDITPLKESLIDLHQSDAKIKALLEAIPDTMLVQDREGKYLDWYANIPDSLYMPPEKFIGVNMKNALPDTIYQKIKTSHLKVVETGKMQLAEYSFPIKNGIVHHEARVVLMNDHSLLTIIRDMTEKKAIDALLNIRNNALSYAINSIFIADAQQPHTPIIYCNQAFEKMTGYATEEILDRNFQFLQNDDRDQKEIDIMNKAIIKGEACNVIVRNYKKDGTLFWNDVTITPIHNDNNQLTHFIGVQNDVTKKVKAENLKEQIKRILELIAKDRPLKMVGKKIVAIIETHIKNSMASILVLDTAKDKFDQLVAPNVPLSFANYIKTTTSPESGASDSTSFLEQIIIAPHISENVLLKDFKDIASKNDIKSWWSFPIMSSTKEIVAIFVIFNNFPKEPSLSEKELISEMIDLISIPIEKEINRIKLQENKLQLENYTHELENRVQERTQEVMSTVQQLVETNFNLEDQILKAERSEKLAKTSKSIASEIAKNFPNGFVAVIDKDLKIHFADGEGLEQLSLGEIFYEGMFVDEIPILPKARKVLAKKNILKTLNGERLTFEIEYKKRYFAVNTVPLVDEHNEINYALHVYSDITQQKEIEFKIQKALQKERELNGLKSSFISMASHEFRTPLSAILTATILINKQNQPGRELKIEKYVSQIEKNINHLTSILNDFLSLSKLEEGKLVATPEQFDLIPFCKAFVKDSYIGIEKEQTIIVKHKSLELLAFLDKKLLSHILNNLLSNASKYSPKGSDIDFKIFQKQHSVVLQITDKGIGIPKEEQKHLYSRFFRAKNAKNIEGTGLGLNIVKHYTELMGGTVDFETELNRGAIFWVTFPIHTI